MVKPRGMASGSLSRSIGRSTPVSNLGYSPVSISCFVALPTDPPSEIVSYSPANFTRVDISGRSSSGLPTSEGVGGHDSGHVQPSLTGSIPSYRIGGRCRSSATGGGGPMTHSVRFTDRPKEIRESNEMRRVQVTDK